MTRLSIVLLLAVLASALMLVHSQHETRRVFMALESAKKQAKKLAIEHDRLRVESQTQAAALRVEKIASQHLQMRTASPGITLYMSHMDAAKAAERILP